MRKFITIAFTSLLSLQGPAQVYEPLQQNCNTLLKTFKLKANGLVSPNSNFISISYNGKTANSYLTPKFELLSLSCPINSGWLAITTNSYPSLKYVMNKVIVVRGILTKRVAFFDPFSISWRGGLKPKQDVYYITPINFDLLSL